jgi:alpha-D-ribose 1-methylphosphonate 5-triphosphate synthase subunit PhnH
MQMMQIDMTTLVPGFNDTVHDAQRVFRALLDALSRPGRIVSLDAALPGNHAMRDALASRVPLAAFASLLALTDYSTPVYLQRDDALFSDALRFHASAPITNTRDEASFVYIDDAANMPSLDAFSQGVPESPELAATLLIRVPSLTDGEPLAWSGPGIERTQNVCISGLKRDFWRERAALVARVPCGIDIYFVAGSALVGMPRTTHVENG